MSKIKELLAWIFYYIGDLIFRITDNKLFGGMSWPVYKLYHCFMCLSDDIQGEGKGPWLHIKSTIEE